MSDTFASRCALTRLCLVATAFGDELLKWTCGFIARLTFARILQSTCALPSFLAVQQSCSLMLYPRPRTLRFNAVSFLLAARFVQVAVPSLPVHHGHPAEGARNGSDEEQGFRRTLRLEALLAPAPHKHQRRCVSQPSEWFVTISFTIYLVKLSILLRFVLARQHHFDTRSRCRRQNK